MCLLVYQNVFICYILTFAVSLSLKLHFLFKTNQMMIHIFAVQHDGNKFFMDVPSSLCISYIYLLLLLLLVFKI